MLLLLLMCYLMLGVESGAVCKLPPPPPPPFWCVFKNVLGISEVQTCWPGCLSKLSSDKKYGVFLVHFINTLDQQNGYGCIAYVRSRLSRSTIPAENAR